MQIVFAYVATLAVFAIIDTLWLGYMGDRFYRPLMDGLLADQFRLVPAIAFYALYAAGLTLFAVLPALRGDGWPTAILWGALFGLFAYGTYNLTSYAVMTTWSLKLTVADMAWGVFVSGASAALGWLGASWLSRTFG